MACRDAGFSILRAFVLTFSDACVVFEQKDEIVDTPLPLITMSGLGSRISTVQRN